MDDIVKYGAALIFLLAAIIYVSIKNRCRIKERKYRERNIELGIYKKEIDRLEEKLRRKEITKDNYERLRKKLEKQHQKNMSQIQKLK